MGPFGRTFGVGGLVQLGSNTTPANGLIEEDTSFYMTEEDSNNILISED